MPTTIPARLLPPFPRVVDETMTRLTAGQVTVLNIVALSTRQWWLLGLVAADYLLRALVGPRFSPLARLATVLARALRLRQHLTAGSPKRFAASIGSAFMVAAVTLALLGHEPAALAVGAVMVVLPAVESAAGFCLGCWIFGQLMRLGAIPEQVCAECADITARLAARASSMTPQIVLEQSGRSSLGREAVDRLR